MVLGKKTNPEACRDVFQSKALQTVKGYKENKTAIDEGVEKLLQQRTEVYNHFIVVLLYITLSS